jgi:hypothetical protein
LRKLHADKRGLLPDIGTLYLNEGIDPAPSHSFCNQLPAQILELNEVFWNANGNVELFGIKSAHFNADGVARPFFSAAAKSCHTVNQDELLLDLSVCEEIISY